MEGERLPDGRGPISRRVRKLYVFYKNWIMPSAVNLFAKDGMNFAKHTMVYRGDYNRIAIWGSVIACGLCVLVVSFLTARDLYEGHVEGFVQDDPYDDLQSIGPQLIVTGALVLLFIKFCMVGSKYVVRMYYNQYAKEYTIVTMDVFRPWTVKKFTCKAGEPVAKNIGTTLSMFLGNVKVHNRSFSIEGQHFKLPVYHNVFFGYTKAEAIEKLRDSNANVDNTFKLRRREFDNEKFDADELSNRETNHGNKRVVDR
jgi:hypothetical protein